ncbi:uncharacterized protein LOC123673377 [Harmonia axyridis]|uniref:uncharacterized protein LOC123673377 n=1 Tax=Harmonia axyridis TaxID=115357 RepID=UPI001E27920C|nr:uncharacterized protein LOC123673377 [Harmonia axyridis]
MKCEEYNCKVTSIVTDNAANVTKMRRDLFEELDRKDVITYGCSAHMLNLLAHDIEVPGINGNIKKICKYFRNVHFASAKFRKAGDSALVLPQDLLWIKSKETLALGIGEATEIWLELLEAFETEQANGEFACSVSYTNKVKERMEMALTPAHFLANLLDHRFRGNKLSQEQIETGMEYVETYHPEALPIIINYQAKCAPFKPYLFSEYLIKNDKVKPLAWWCSIKNINTTALELAQQLHSAIASSANIERLFSSYGLVHSKLRNRLGNAKAAKLVSIFKELNSISDDVTDQIDDYKSETEKV